MMFKVYRVTNTAGRSNYVAAKDEEMARVYFKLIGRVKRKRNARVVHAPAHEIEQGLKSLLRRNLCGKIAKQVYRPPPSQMLSGWKLKNQFRWLLYGADNMPPAKSEWFTVHTNVN
jgi:hypothetical protein